MGGVMKAHAELKEDDDEGTGAANAENEKDHDGKADVVKKHLRLNDKASSAIKVRSLAWLCFRSTGCTFIKT